MKQKEAIDNLAYMLYKDSQKTLPKHPHPNLLSKQNEASSAPKNIVLRKAYHHPSKFDVYK